MRDAATALRDQGGRLRDVSTHLVHVAANDWPAMLLARHASGLILENGVRLEISVAAGADNLTPREADNAIWHGLPKSGDHITRKIGSLECAIHASAGLAKVASRMECSGWFKALPWIAFNET